MNTESNKKRITLSKYLQSGGKIQEIDCIKDNALLNGQIAICSFHKSIVGDTLTYYVRPMQGFSSNYDADSISFNINYSK